MKCPKCKSEQTSVKQTIRVTGASKVLRRRSCDVCGHKFQTTEEPNVSTAEEKAPPVPEPPVEETPDKPVNRKRKPPTKKSEESE